MRYKMAHSNPRGTLSSYKMVPNCSHHSVTVSETQVLWHHFWWRSDEADGVWRPAAEKRHSRHQRSERTVGVPDFGARGNNSQIETTCANKQTSCWAVYLFWWKPYVLFRRESVAHLPFIFNNSISQKASVPSRSTVRQKELLWVNYKHTRSIFVVFKKGNKINVNNKKIYM